MENLLFFRNLQIFLSLEEVFELLALRPSLADYSFIIHISINTCQQGNKKRGVLVLSKVFD